MTQPRVAAFARVANGAAAPVRIIAGQVTKLGRTIHGLAYDPIHDEIIVPNPLADAILVFRGDASGAVAPIRIIQGARTQLVTPHAVSLDLTNGEILVASLTGKRVNIFPWNANGNAAPKRVIQGPKTELGHIVGLAVDPVKDLLAVANSDSIDIFNRSDTGDIAPRARIAGPHADIGDEPWGMEFYQGKIFVAASHHFHENLYTGVTLKSGVRQVPEDPWLNPDLGFVGVWNITDTGDIAPRAIIRGPFSGLLHPVGLALNPAAGEIYVSDSVHNGVLSFMVPDFFAQSSTGSAGGDTAPLADPRKGKQ